MGAEVVAVSRSATHSFRKDAVGEVVLVAGFGVEGDAHAGATVRHRYMVRRDPRAANLCQVHLLHEELFAELAKAGILVGPGEMGENVTTRGLDLMGQGLGARLHLGATAIVKVTGMREPCALMNQLRPGLMKACVWRDTTGEKVRRAGIMGVVEAGGAVRAGDAIEVEEAVGGWVRLGPV